MQTALLQIANILGELLGIAGLLVFGLAMGWLALRQLRESGQNWPVRIAVFLGLLGVVAVLAWVATPGELGAFTLGCAIAIFIWGLPGKKAAEPQKEEPAPEESNNPG
jgi:hypothetical protein